MIIEGFILVFLGIILLVLVVIINNLNSSSGYETYNGMIVESNIDKKEVIINYTIKGVSYSAPYNCEVYANTNEMPPKNLKVQVSISPDNPSEIVFVHFMREMGRGLNGKHQYIDNESGRNRKSLIFLCIGLFGAGIYMILEGFGVI